MDLDAVITQLKNYAPVLGTRVAGAAEFSRAVADQVWMPLPAAYVVPLDEDATPNDIPNALRQKVTERVGVIVVFDNSADRRGQTVSELFDSTRTDLWSALLNWRIDPRRAARGLEYGGGRQLNDLFDRARCFYRWDFELEVTVTDADGFQVVGSQLLEIDATFNKGATGETYAVADIHLPQT